MGRAWGIYGFVVFAGCAASPADGGFGCSETADTCPDDTICVAGGCEDAFPRVYAITDVQLSVPTTDPNGEPWDAGGGAPDLFVKISVDNTVVATTQPVQDSFAATFAGPFQVQLIAGSSLVIATLDSDLTLDDSVFDCVAAPITSDQLRGRLQSCTGNTGTMLYTIEPM